MDRSFLDFGVIKIYYYSIFILLGVLVAIFVIFKEARRHGLDKDTLIDLSFYTIIFGVLGARCYYVLFNLSYYLKNPLEIFYIWHGGLAIHGGIIAGCIYIFYFCRKNKINFLKLLDIVVVGLIIGQVIGRWGNFFNKEAYGAITTFNWLAKMHIPKFIIDGMYINGNYYQPAFLYESIFNFIGFILLFLVRGNYKKLKIGQLTGIYMVWYSIIRFIIEGMRLDSLMFGPLRVAQLVSFVLFIIGIILIFVKNDLYNERGIYEEK